MYSLKIMSEGGWRKMPFKFEELEKAMRQASTTMKRKGRLVHINFEEDDNEN